MALFFGSLKLAPIAGPNSGRILREGALLAGRVARETSCDWVSICRTSTLSDSADLPSLICAPRNIVPSPLLSVMMTWKPFCTGLRATAVVVKAVEAIEGTTVSGAAHANGARLYRSTFE